MAVCDPGSTKLELRKISSVFDNVEWRLDGCAPTNGDGVTSRLAFLRTGGVSSFGSLALRFCVLLEEDVEAFCLARC